MEERHKNSKEKITISRNDINRRYLYIKKHFIYIYSILLMSTVDSILDIVILFSLFLSYDSTLLNYSDPCLNWTSLRFASIE